ncbi:DgyrCDS7996 [Dimorphilus gyrociliatus]|uniref:DgyrCDS7996 n=1 Tax=Dimorphilus gyrociliatus TaxID=2664684 RepID=A0A7I8VSW0_9ANNE|nr:DgyrCDS7996 [Dimorphilus gyrociliatus]
MSRASEDVLLIIKHVRHKKTDGELYLMSERMAWMQSSKRNFNISHNYADIKVQKISPEAKEKVQLQIVLHDSGANTFHFNNPAGRKAQKKDREEVKELLQQLLPKFRVQVNSELVEKNRILQEDPQLFQLYKELVVTGIMPAEEFWTFMDEKKKKNINLAQKVGITPDFLSLVRTEASGANELNYKLTKDIIESIFRAYPAVYKKYMENVPTVMKEEEFWHKFFQSYYFHKERLDIRKDFFSDCSKNDEEVIEKCKEKCSNDPVLNMRSMYDRDIDEAYGQNEKVIADPSPLIKRLNQHSTMVLTAVSNTPIDHSKRPAEGPLDDAASAKRIKLQELTKIPDLATEETAEGIRLKLKRPDHYLCGLHYAHEALEDHMDPSLFSQDNFYRNKQAYEFSLPRVSHASNTALNVLSSLDNAANSRVAARENAAENLIPKDIKSEVILIYKSGYELLKHFWACFPLNSTPIRNRANQMKENLEKFQQMKMKPLLDKLSNHAVSDLKLLDHLNKMFDVAFGKYRTYKTKLAQNKG